MAVRNRSVRVIRGNRVKAASRPARHDDRMALRHDVRVYEEELTAQAEELSRAKGELELARDQFVELYDFAPTAYLTLDKNGIILRINLTGAAMLGRARDAIVGLPILSFAIREHRSAVLDFLRQCRRPSSSGHSVDLTLQTFDGPREVQFICRSRPSHSYGRQELFASVIDLSERRQLERGREEASRARTVITRRLISAQEDERRRIARDLHDNIGQQVTGLRLRVSSLSAKGELRTDVRAALTEVQEALRHLDRTIDFISSELRPASLDLGFRTAIEQFVRQWSTTFGIVAEVTSRGVDGTRLRPDVETHAYRIVQEALHNVYKHAGARRAQIVLEREGPRLTVLVRDNGKGFAPQPPDPDRQGMGLMSMRERAEIIGASLQLASRPKQGTTVSLWVPQAILESHNAREREAAAAGAKEPPAPDDHSASPQRPRAARRAKKVSREST